MSARIKQLDADGNVLQEGAEGTDCPAEKYTACDGCMTTCAGQMVCGGTGDDGKKPSGDDRK